MSNLTTELDSQLVQPLFVYEDAEKVPVKRKRAPGGGRKKKSEDELYVPVAIRLHPKALEWAKAEAEKRGVGYQSVINETLLEHIVL